MKPLDMDFNPFETLNDNWALVTAGNKNKFNSMTISWGSFGVLWFKNVATIYIRKSRYTYELLKDNDYFTISFYDTDYKKDLSIMGTKSGRDTDKLKETSLTPKYLSEVVTYEEAEITLVCKKIYVTKMNVNDMPEEIQKQFYENDSEHYMIIGEIIDKIEM